MERCKVLPFHPARVHGFFARNPGAWGTDLRVSIAHTERTPIPVAQAAAAGSDHVQLQSTSGLYPGAIVDIDCGPNQGFAREQQVIKGIEGNLVTLRAPLAHSLSSGPHGSSLQLLEIDITISDTSGSAATEVFSGLTWNTENLRKHYANQINARSKLVYVQPPGVDGLSGSESQRWPINGYREWTSHGTESSGRLYIGLPEAGLPVTRSISATTTVLAEGLVFIRSRTWMTSVLSPFREQPALCCAERTDHAMFIAALPICGVGQPRPDQDGSVTSILNHRSLYDTSYAAYYAPWVAVANGSATDYLPPSGFIAGIFARTDNERGVHKAPANEVVRNSVGLQSYFTTGEQDILNLEVSMPSAALMDVVYAFGVPEHCRAIQSFGT